jgi:hypothetical protein
MKDVHFMLMINLGPGKVVLLICEGCMITLVPRKVFIC